MLPLVTEPVLREQQLQSSPSYRVLALPCSASFQLRSYQRVETPASPRQASSPGGAVPISIPAEEISGYRPAPSVPRFSQSPPESPDAPAPSQCAAPPPRCTESSPAAPGCPHPFSPRVPTVRFPRCTCPPPPPVPRPFLAPAKTGTGQSARCTPQSPCAPRPQSRRPVSCAPP